MEAFAVTKWVILLRGINVSGHKLIKMQLLRDFLISEGFTNVITYIQSGNIVLESTENNASVLATQIEVLLEKKYGYHVPTMVRSDDAFLKVIDSNPFQNRTFHEKEKVYVGFLKEQPTTDAKKALESLSTENETFKIVNNQVYVVCIKDGRKLVFTNTFVERKLKVNVTFRNWNTVTKICVLIDS